MTEEERPVKWFKRWWKVVSGAVIFAAALVTVIAFFTSRSSTGTPSDAEQVHQRSPSAEVTNSDPVTAGTTATGPDLRPGFNCSESDGAPVTCDGPHSFEAVMVTTDCSPSVLVPYLGGDVDVDVLRPDSGSAVVETGGESVCGITAPGGGPLTSLAHDALRGAAGDAWRWCLSQEDDESIGCSTPHDREVVGPIDAAAGPLDCGARADRYLEVPLRNHNRQLYVTSEQVDEAQRCVIGVRGDNRLTASLRRLRSGSPPITAS